MPPSLANAACHTVLPVLLMKSVAPVCALALGPSCKSVIDPECT